MLAASGYQTKKSLKESVGKKFNYTEISMFGAEFRPTGDNTVVGPSPYERKWYAIVTCKDGEIVKVK